MPALLPLGKLSIPHSRDLSPANLTHGAAGKPLDAVLGRIALLLVMFAGALILIALPLTYVLAEWEAAAAAIGLVLIYGGVSFFIRPQMDSQNWGGRAATTEGDAARLHRLLVVLYWMSAPGRFAAETLLDSCVLIGLAKGSEVTAGNEQTLVGATFPLAPSQFSQAAWTSRD